MTTLVDRPHIAEADAPAALPQPEPAPVGPDRNQRRPGLSLGAQFGVALAILVGLVLGFVGYLYGLTTLSEQHAQITLRKGFANSLANAVAPTGPVAPGTPVATLSIPRLGLDQIVVVEGTTARNMAAGPGHRRDTVLPGQAGVSAIYGRRMTFGAPFAHLLALRVGDIITATTGQGVSKYRVSSFGDSAHPAPANSANRLVLVTADAGTVPHQLVMVSADLITKAHPASGVLPAIPSDEANLASSDDGTLLTTLLWSQALLLLAIGVPFFAVRWSPLATYLCAAPIVLAVLWNLYENLALLLPNMY